VLGAQRSAARRGGSDTLGEKRLRADGGRLSKRSFLVQANIRPWVGTAACLLAHRRAVQPATGQSPTVNTLLCAGPPPPPNTHTYTSRTMDGRTRRCVRTAPSMPRAHAQLVDASRPPPPPLTPPSTHSRHERAHLREDGGVHAAGRGVVHLAVLVPLAGHGVERQRRAHVPVCVRAFRRDLNQRDRRRRDLNQRDRRRRDLNQRDGRRRDLNQRDGRRLDLNQRDRRMAPQSCPRFPALNSCLYSGPGPPASPDTRQQGAGLSADRRGPRRGPGGCGPHPGQTTVTSTPREATCRRDVIE
jgi:hypothetical protein